MQKLTGRFRLDRSCNSPSPIFSSNPDPPSASPADSLFHFRVHPPAVSSKPAAGSFQSDMASSRYQKRWDNWGEFQNWIAEEQTTHAIELRHVNTYAGLPEFERKLRYVCSRGGTGGMKPYVKLHPDRTPKIDNKRTECKCRLLVKQYPGISTILGDYLDEHDHALGNANLRFTQIPKETREYIAGLLRLGLEPDHIVSLLNPRIYHI